MVSALPDGPVQSAGLRAGAMKGGLFLFGRQVGSVLLKLIGVLLISRVLGPEKYGSYVAAYGIYQYTLSLGQAGLGICLLRHQGEVDEIYYRTTATLLLAMAAIIVAGMLICSNPISQYVGIANFQAVSLTLLVALPLQLLVVPPQVKLERALNYRAVAAVELGGQIVYYAVAIPLVLGNFGAIGLAISWIAQQAVTLTMAHVLSRTIPKFGWNTSIAKYLIGYSTSYSAANWIWQARSLVNPLIVAPLLGAYAVGIIGMTVGILEMLSIIKTIAWRLSVVIIGRFQDDKARIRQAITEGMELQTLSIGVIVLGFSWFGYWIIPLVFGARWLPLLQIYPFVALSYLTSAPFNMHSATMSVLHRNRLLAVFHTVHIVVFVLVTRLSIPHVGMIGYGLGELATLPAYALLHIFLARQVGSPSYKLTLIWWAGAALGLFWRQLGWWTILMPFIVLLLPISQRKLQYYLAMVFKSPRLRARTTPEVTGVTP